MENQKNNKGVIALLIIIIIILAALCVLFATGTISFKDKNKESNSINVNNQVSNTTDENNQNMIGVYKGTDPWDYNMIVEVKSVSQNEMNLVISNDYYKKQVSTELINGVATFNIQGNSDDNRYEVNYSMALVLNTDNISVKFISGYLTSISPNGNASFANVGPLTEGEKTVVLKKEV